jgi:hypothetical protein
MALTGSDKAYKHARANVARAGASRLNYFTPIRPVLTLNGADRSAFAVAGTWRVALNWADQPDILTGRIDADASFTPTAGQTLVLGIGESQNRVFGGRLKAVTQLYVGRPANMYYDVMAVDDTDVLTKKLVRKRYVNADASEIVLSIMSLYTSGVTTAHVQGSLGTIDDISFLMEPVPDALTRVSERIDGCRWFVDEFSDLHFGTAIPASPAPASLTNTSTTPFRNVSLRRDLSQIRTRVYVEGRGSVLSDQQIASLATDPDLHTDTPSEVFALPGDYGGGTFYVRWKSVALGYTTLTDVFPDQLTGDSGNSALWVASGEERAREGDEINQWVTRNDTSAQTTLASLEGGDGIREMYVQDRRLSYDGAVLRGDAELASNSAIADVLEYETTDVNARPGRDVTVSLTGAFSMSGTYRIQQVTIDAIGGLTTQFPWRRVTATSTTRLDLWDLLKRTASPTFVPF